MSDSAENDAPCEACGHSGLYCEATPRGCCRDCGHRAEKDAPRVKVACINWFHADAPHALIYLLRDGEAVAERFVDTWADAMALAPRYARAIPSAKH